MTKLLTASGLPRARRCAWWLRDEAEWSDATTTSDEARLGSAFHAVMAYQIDHLRTGRPEGDYVGAIAENWNVDRDAVVGLVQAVDREGTFDLVVAGFQTEVMAEKAFAYDPFNETVRELQLPGPREYSLNPGELGLTVDVVAVGDDYVFVADWKTGFGRGLDPLATNLQIRLAGLVAAAFYGREVARIAIVRVNEDGAVLEVERMSAFDFDAVAAELRSIVNRIGSSNPTPGSWCQYCPAAAGCPAISKAIVEVIEPPPPATFKLGALPVNHEDAAYRVQLLPLLKAAVDRFEAGIKQYADATGGFPTSPGKVYRRVEGSRESIELNPAAIEWLRLELGDRFDEAVRPATSKSAIEAVIKGIGKPKSVVDSAFVQLRGLGAIKSSPTTTYKEVKA